MTETVSRRITLASRPHGLPKPENFQISDVELPRVADGEVLIRTIYLTLDPYMRGMMEDAESYDDPIPLGGVIVGSTVSEVVESRDPSLAPGDIVESYVGWQSHAVVPAAHLRRIDPNLAPITTALGVLGMPGLTAYHGLLKVGLPRSGETVFVSAASGAVGATVGQIARIKGCRVVGCAGSDEKVAYCLDDCGFDACINYKTCGDFEAALREACSDGIDVNFENVGGPISRAVMMQLNEHARMAVCGTISNYNATDAEMVPDNLWWFIVRRIRVEGLLVTDFAEHDEAARAELASWIEDGRMIYRETIVDGFDNAPVAFNRLFEGSNFGKLIVAVGDDPTKG
ncbi:MAG: NADP-dependent oxidoreductase [Rhodospirillaceae bacterium]|nr:NADP-dependent oxidoreductase [Rhodospirillaceae bacterium]|tara:strand:+ start:2472 stop:3500 length:1029 start_codon:yes stop_codon:yes gene_type:complete